MTDKVRSHLKIGKRYGITYPEYRSSDPYNPHVVPATTVYFIVESYDSTRSCDGSVNIRFDNGCTNTLSVGCPMERDAFPVD